MNPPTPLVSIIVPVFKVENYLNRCVDSLLNQSYNNLEIILVDDGSPDRCPEICDEYAALDNRVKVIHKPNGGVSSARNAGLDMASGEYITFLDSDDWIDEKMIHLMVDSLIGYECDSVCVSINIVDKENNITNRFRSQENVILSGSDTAKLMLRDSFPYNFCWGKIFRKDLFDGIRFPVGRIYEDNATTYKAISRASKVYILSDCLYYYFREREGNTTSELKSDRAAFSYYCGCVNCTEYIQFCSNNATFSDVIPDINYYMTAWSKLCIESAIKSNKKEYNEYCRKVKKLIREHPFAISNRLKWILFFSNLYYYIYPIIGRNS